MIFLICGREGKHSLNVEQCTPRVHWEAAWEGTGGGEEVGMEERGWIMDNKAVRQK